MLAGTHLNVKKENISETDTKKLFQDLDRVEKDIIDALVIEDSTIYSLKGYNSKGEKLNRTSIYRRIKGKLANNSNLIDRAYVYLVRKEPYKGNVKKFYGLTFKGYCAAITYGSKTSLEKLAENWKTFDCSSKLEMIASLKLWLKYRTMMEKSGFSKIYFSDNWEKDFKCYKYAPVVEIMNILSRE